MRTTSKSNIGLAMTVLVILLLIWMLQVNAYAEIRGTINYDDGVYTGEIVNGMPNGQGTRTWASGEKYIGEWKDGKRHGQGTGERPNGDKYSGEWKDGKPHGYGFKTDADGARTVGEFKAGYQDGYGLYTQEDGLKWIGNFVPDDVNKVSFVSGQGLEVMVLDEVNVVLKYAGEFEGGKRHGFGVSIQYGDYGKQDGDQEVGEFRNDAFWQGIEYDKVGAVVGTQSEGVLNKSLSKQIEEHLPGVITCNAYFLLMTQFLKTNGAEKKLIDFQDHVFTTLSAFALDLAERVNISSDDLLEKTKLSINRLVEMRDGAQGDHRVLFNEYHESCMAVFNEIQKRSK
tara:strand:- start:870 stop:1895 length:1026 start_codon:yes stop_codon:yes gene_type:complete